MNLDNFFDGTATDWTSLTGAIKQKKSVNESFFKKMYDAAGKTPRYNTVKDAYGNYVNVPISDTNGTGAVANGKNEWTLSEFLNLQKAGEDSAELASYLDLKGWTLRSLGDDAGEKLNNQINTQAALQVIQNFYDMYISPVGETDAKYRLGEVTGKAKPGTVNNQTDEFGRLRTRALFNSKVDYKEWEGTSLKDKTEYYSVIWFPPYSPLNIKPTSWKGISTKKYDKATGLEVDNNGYLLDATGQRIKYKHTDGKWYYRKSQGETSSVSTMTMKDYLAQAKEKRQKELDEKNQELRDDGKEVTVTEAEDTRLAIKNETDKYYDTYDMESGLAARSSFTYRAPGFKAINDNINMLQWVLEGMSGIVSTYLTEWDLSIYLQEGLVTNTESTLPNIIMLTHRLDKDNPNQYGWKDSEGNPDDRAASWGVINCAISKIYGDNHKSWIINAYPYAQWHTLYPDPTALSGWLDKITAADGTTAYVPNYYRIAKAGLRNYLEGKDNHGRVRGDSVQNRLMFQDFEGAALSGYKEWNYGNKIWKALYTSADDGFSDVDILFLQTAIGLYHKRDLIEDVQIINYQVGGNGEPYDGYDMIVGGNDASGNGQNTGYSFNDPEEGSGGNKYCPGSVFKGALTFLNMFNKRDSSKESALSRAGANGDGSVSENKNVYGTIQDSLGATKAASSNNAIDETAERAYLLGTDKGLTDNSNGVGVPQYNPTLYGGPHSYYRSPKSYQSYYQENNIFLRNVPRIDKCPDSFDHDADNGITWPSLPNWQDDYYYKGNEKWCSNVSAVVNGERQAYEQSWSAGLARLKKGHHSTGEVPAYLRVKVYSDVEFYAQLQWHWGWNYWHWGWWDWKWVRPSHYSNGEPYHYEGYGWWQWFHKDLGLTSSWWWYGCWNHGWYDYYWSRYYNYSWYYRWEWTGNWWGWRLSVAYYAPCQRAWHYEWKFTTFKRYVLHSEPNAPWRIVQTRHYESYLPNNSSSVFKNAWNNSYRALFGYSKDYAYLFATQPNEDYELFVDGPQGGNYSNWSILNEATGQVLNVYQTNAEHNIMTSIVDWWGGMVGAHNKAFFLTRDGAGRPDCLFRAEIFHNQKPVYYFCLHSRTYSSNKRKYWWERHCGWKTYMSVKLYSTDRFWAGLSKPTFTNYGSVNNGEDSIGVSSPPIDGSVTAETANNSILSVMGAGYTGTNCCETRKTPYDLITGITGREIPLFDTTIVADGIVGADRMIGSYNGISGVGIIGDIPGLDFEADDGAEIYSNKCCSKQKAADMNGGSWMDVAFKNIRFPMWQISGWINKGEVTINGNTYRPEGNGFAIYREITPPNWWHAMILNMGLRNTFYRGDANGPLRVNFKVLQYGIDVEGKSFADALTYIESRGCTVQSAAGSFKIKASDIRTYTTVKRLVTLSKDGVEYVENHDIVDTVYLKNAWSALKYYFTSFDIAPRFLYNILATQEGYLNFAKDFICGKDEHGQYIVSFDFIRKMIEGTAKSPGLISPRTYYLADPRKNYIADPNGDIIINEKTGSQSSLNSNGTLPAGCIKASWCEDIYGYNPWIKTAREWFCNSPSENQRLHDDLGLVLDQRKNTILKVQSMLKPYLYMDMGSYSYNSMNTAWKSVNEFIDLKTNEEPERFLLAYLNVLYEARRYFINKRCNKQDGTLWMCRHLEKMLPQVIGSAVASAGAVDMTAFQGKSSKIDVSFYEIQNTLAMKADVLKKQAQGSNAELEPDRIKTVYVKVKYVSYERYLACQEKLKDGTLKRTDERVVPVQPIAFVKKRDGSFKNKANGDKLAADETWNENGWAIRKGKIKYAVKPEDGVYKLYSVEKHRDEDNAAKKLQNPNGPYITYDYDDAKWNIDWSKMAEDNQILFNYYGGVDTSALKDLTASGETDPQALLCGAKQAADYWIVPVQSVLPRAIGYRSQLTLEMITDGSIGMEGVSTKDNPVALVGASAYAMWPIIEDQTDVMPNNGDFAKIMSGLGA